MITEQYIQQCEKVEKIQAGHVKGDGDILVDILIVNGKRIQQRVLFWSKTYSNDPNVCHEQDGFLRYYLWLPTQAQLQEMVDLPNQHIDIYCEGGKYWIAHWIPYEGEELEDDFGHSTNNYDTAKYTSMEELWLAFVMKEKYSKIWNGENWVEQV